MAFEHSSSHLTICFTVYLFALGRTASPDSAIDDPAFADPGCPHSFYPEACEETRELCINEAKDLVGVVQTALHQLQDKKYKTHLKYFPKALGVSIEETHFQGLKHLQLNEAMSSACTADGPAVSFTLATSEPLGIKFTSKKCLGKSAITISSQRALIGGSVTKKCTEKDVSGASCTYDVEVDVVEADSATIDLSGVDDESKSIMDGLKAKLSDRVEYAWKRLVKDLLEDVLAKQLKSGAK
ncbi:uncharacterized protein LOC135371392 [Ornithodoros turicata]|uniref:uncharacterized protein LOC135371392 n=1 Tax=Ornithodoros turicata TaxID=34597 RepID=UPI00313994A9